ncbi:MAG: hypothetical protein ACRDYE_14535, partial [Acidimicrobiales bacterium]
TQEQCLENALGNYGAWKHTAVDYTFNPDYPYASMMSACAASEITGQLPICIVDNHGLTDTVIPRQSGLYAEIDTLWQQFGHLVPVDFQTISPNGFNLCQAIDVGVTYHAQSIEVWPAGTGFAGFTQYTPAQMAAWDDAVVQGTTPACS